VTLQACLAATADPAPAAWVRVACLRDVSEPEATLARMLGPVSDFLRETAVAHLAWLAIESWPNPWLPRLGFHHYCDVETYIKNDLDLPEGRANSELTIRPVQADDIPALAAIEAAAFAPLWRHSAEALRAVQQIAFSFDVALLQGAPVGFQFSTQSEQHVHLARMTVAPQAQQQGVGSALLRHAVRAYRRRRFRYVSLNTQTDNTPSRRLYEKFGFEPSGQRYPVWLKQLD
jgi:ribosomal protein S18 acetylase RimI-like enzyme